MYTPFKEMVVGETNAKEVNLQSDEINLHSPLLSPETLDLEDVDMEVIDNFGLDDELIVNETGTANGTTELLDVSAVSGQKLTTGAFIPAGFTSSFAVDIIVYLHGLFKYGDNKNGIATYFKNYADIPSYFSQTGRNAILLAPTLSSNPQQASVTLNNKGGFDRFLTACLKALQAKGHLTYDADYGNIIVAGHSAGGRPLSNILRYDGIYKNKIVECWGFDCLYSTGWADPINQWAKGNKNFYHYWAWSCGGNNLKCPRVVGEKYTANPNFKSIPSAPKTNHQQVIKQAWLGDIKSRSWFTQIAGAAKDQELDDYMTEESIMDTEGNLDTEREGLSDFFVGPEELIGDIWSRVNAALSPAVVAPTGGGLSFTKYPLMTTKIVIQKRNDKLKLAEIKEAPAVFLKEIVRNAGENENTWFDRFTQITFLGRSFNSGQYIQETFALHLKKLEKKLALAYGGPTADPKLAGDALGLTEEKFAGSRKESSTATFSFHMFGLAIDVNYKGSPFIQASDAFNKWMAKIGKLLDNKIIKGVTWGFKKSLNDYMDFYDELATANNKAVKYFSLSEVGNDAELKSLLAGCQFSEWNKLTPDQARKEIDNDLKALSKAWKGYRTEPEKIFRKGFLGVSRDFVKAMVESGLDWGGRYGDIMHFDMRSTGAGANIERAKNQYINDMRARARTLYSAVTHEGYQMEGVDYENYPEYEDDQAMEIQDLENAEPETIDMEQDDEVDIEGEDFNFVDASALKDDLLAVIPEDDIIGLGGDNKLNIQLTGNDADFIDRKSVSMKLAVRAPGKSREMIVTKAISIPKTGKDPLDPSKVIFQLSVDLDDIGKIIKPIDGINEIASVRRIDGTSDKFIIKALGTNWKSRGQAEQPNSCGANSASMVDERPDALKLMQAGGVAVMELKDSKGKVWLKRFIKNPADIFYYTGHGIGVGFARGGTSENCLAVEPTLCCWAKPADLLPHWKGGMDLDTLIIAGCSILGVDGTKDPLDGDGVEWAKLTKSKGGPLLNLIGYGDWDPNENEGIGPEGHTAPKDDKGGNTIAKEIGAWIKANPAQKKIIQKWLMINMEHQNPFAVGIDKEGVYWRTRRKASKGWKTISNEITRSKIKYVIETKNLP